MLLQKSIDFGLELTIVNDFRHFYIRDWHDFRYKGRRRDMKILCLRRDK